MKIECIRCNCEIEIKPKGWARKYCEVCRKIINNDKAKERATKNKETIKKRKILLIDNPRPKIISCEKCGIDIDNACWNKKYCNECKKVKHTDISKIWAENNPERKKEIDKRYPERKRERGRRFRINNPILVKLRDKKRYLKECEIRKEYSRKRHKLYPEQIREAKRRYRASEHGKLKCQEHHRLRRARKNNVIHKFTLEEWKIKLAQTKGVCPMCNKFVEITNLTLDHNPPISRVPKGFVYTIWEVEPICSSCNSKKYNKMDWDTAMKLYEYIEENKEL